MNNTTRFDGKGELYAKARPTYAAELLDTLKHTVPMGETTVFADIGAGTGIFTRQLLNSGYRGYAIEPNADMRKKAAETLADCPGVTLIDGTDSHTTLPGGSVDLITAAQAFHWFDAEGFKAECRRILKPGGSIVIVYNIRDEAASCNKALAALHRRYCPDFHGFSGGIDDAACRGFFDGKCTVFRAANPQIYNREGYVSRILSSSYSPREGDERYAEYLLCVNQLFDTFSRDGTMLDPLDTVAYIGTV